MPGPSRLVHISKNSSSNPHHSHPFCHPHQLRPPDADFTGREKEIDATPAIFAKASPSPASRAWAGSARPPWAWSCPPAKKPVSRWADLPGPARRLPTGALPDFRSLRDFGSLAAHVSQRGHAACAASFEPQAKLPDDPDALSGLYCTYLEGKQVLLFFDNARGSEQLEPLLPPSGCDSGHFAPAFQPARTGGAGPLDTLAPRDARRTDPQDRQRGESRRGGSIARQCGYLPLALRLAAGMLNTRPDWTPADLVGKLQDALRLLEPLEASLRLSYGLLDDGCKLAFRRLGIFPASFRSRSGGSGLGER